MINNLIACETKVTKKFREGGFCEIIEGKTFLLKY